MDLANLEEAVLSGIDQHLAELDAIAANKDAPTFDNTIVPMEQSGRALDRVFTYYGIWSSNLSSPEFREVQGRVVPKLSEYSSKIIQNEALFRRVKAIYESEDLKQRDAAVQRLVRLMYDQFARSRGWRGSLRPRSRWRGSFAESRRCSFCRRRRCVPMPSPPGSTRALFGVCIAGCSPIEVSVKGR
jgi:hypothetical protein